MNISSQKLLASLKIIGLALVLALGIQYAFAQTSTWTAAPANPPGSNAAAPINVGTSGQSKLGALSIGTATQQVGAILNVVGGGLFDTLGITGNLVVSGGNPQPGEVLVSQDTSGTAAWGVDSSAQSAPVEVIYTPTSPSKSWTAPAGVTRVHVYAWGGGGGGGACDQATYSNGNCLGGGGGGGGGFVNATVSVVPNTPYTIQIGGGGSGGIPSVAVLAARCGQSGGDSTFGSFITAHGGSGGHADDPDCSAVAGGLGGSYSSSGVGAQQGYGVTGQSGTTGNYIEFAPGGSSSQGGFGSASYACSAPTSPGGGGSGGAQSSGSSGCGQPNYGFSGADGMVIVEY